MTVLSFCLMPLFTAQIFGDEPPTKDQTLFVIEIFLTRNRLSGVHHSSSHLGKGADSIRLTEAVLVNLEIIVSGQCSEVSDSSRPLSQA